MPGYADNRNAGKLTWVTPARWQELGATAFRIDIFRGQEFLLIFPEWFVSREIGINAAFTWTVPPEQGDWRQDDYSAHTEVSFYSTAGKMELAWQCRFHNGSEGELTGLCAFNCFNLNWAPYFKDLSMERTWLLNEDGEKTFLCNLVKRQGEGRRTMQFYPAEKGVDLHRIPKVIGYDVVNSTPMHGDRIGVISTDGKWQVENIVDGPVGFFFNNWESDHGCIHAAPMFGRVKPGSFSTVSGRILFSRHVK